MSTFSGTQLWRKTQAGCNAFWDVKPYSLDCRHRPFR